jgi:type IV secretory system conjugative DNA transfer VirD4/TraG family protein
MSVWRAREAKTAATYGSARWATLTEIRAAGLTAPDGAVLGRFERDYLRHDGPKHVLCFAPTRSGKGVGLVVPTLLTWPGSCIVHDIKGENWTLTSGFRAQHGRMLLYDPTNAKSVAYNPLLEVRRRESEVRDVQNVADVRLTLIVARHWDGRRRYLSFEQRVTQPGRAEEVAQQKERERRQRAVAKAQSALDAARRKHEKNAADIQAQIEAPEERSRAEIAHWEKEKARLEAALRRARGG